jgi:hypothetical protein
MKKRANSLLGGASQEELTACIRLLALSAVQHRATGSFVPFRDCAEHLNPQGNDPEKAGLLAAGRSTVEEVLKLLAQSSDSEGLRQHARPTQRLDIQFDGDEYHATLKRTHPEISIIVSSDPMPT